MQRNNQESDELDGDFTHIPSPYITSSQLQAISLNISSTRQVIEIFYYDSYAMLMRVYVVFSFMWIVWVALIAIGYVKDRYKAFSSFKDKMSKVHSTPESIIQVRANSIDVLALRDPLLDRLNGLCADLLVGVYSTGSAAYRCTQAMNIKNEYMHLLLQQDSSALYLYKVLRVFTRSTLCASVMLYMNMHLYANDSADECWNRRSESECVGMNIYDSTNLLRRYCVWQPYQSDLSVPLCQLSDPDITLNSTIYLAMLGCAAMTLLNIPLNFIFEYILLAHEIETNAVVGSGSNNVKDSVSHVKLHQVLPSLNDKRAIDDRDADFVIDIPSSPFSNSDMNNNSITNMLNRKKKDREREQQAQNRLLQYVRKVNTEFSNILITRNIESLKIALALEMEEDEAESQAQTVKRRRRLSLQWGFDQETLLLQSMDRIEFKKYAYFPDLIFISFFLSLYYFFLAFFYVFLSLLFLLLCRSLYSSLTHHHMIIGTTKL